MVPPTARSFPADAPATAYAPTLMGYFAEAERLWDEEIQLCLHPGRKISPKHAQRIADNLKVITESLLSVCSDYDAQIMARPLLRRLPEAQEEEREALVSALTYVPVSALDPEGLSSLLDTLGGLLQNQDVPLRLTIFRCFQTMLEQDPDLKARLEPVLAQLDAGGVLRRGLPADGSSEPVLRTPGSPAPGRHQRAFLSNLKNALHWTVKLVHIDLLAEPGSGQPQ